MINNWVILQKIFFICIYWCDNVINTISYSTFSKILKKENLRLVAITSYFIINLHGKCLYTYYYCNEFKGDNLWIKFYREWREHFTWSSSRVIEITKNTILEGAMKNNDKFASEIHLRRLIACINGQLNKSFEISPQQNNPVSNFAYL